MRTTVPMNRDETRDFIGFSSRRSNMKYKYPTPDELGIVIPKSLYKDQFNDGFEHALKGLHLTERSHLCLSFRSGYRSGKLYCKYLRRKQGIVDFPMQGKVRFKVA
jgi:hypothetical protein